MADKDMSGTHPRTDYRILGPVEVWVADRRVPFGGARSVALLALLLSEPGRVIGLDRMVDALWDRDPPDTARQLIHTSVSRLRRSLRAAGLGDVLVTDGPGYRAAVESDEVDAGRFDRLVREASAAASDGPNQRSVGLLRQALDQWRGPALSGVDGAVLEAVGASLDERRLAAVDSLAQGALATGEHADLIAELRPWIADQPLRERLRELMILALYRTGRRADALAEYDQIRRLLADDLGMDPGPGLTELHGRVLADDPALRVPPPATTAGHVPPAPDHPPSDGSGHPPGAGPAGAEATGAEATGAEATRTAAAERRPAGPSLLPAPVADFTGRAAELAIMLASIDGRTGPRVVTIDGMAGIGKTTVAVQAARELADEFPDGQLFVDLLGHTPGRRPLTSATALAVLLRSVDVPAEAIPGELEAAAALWRATITGRRILVVLDNALDSAQLRPLLTGTDGSLVLVTSRRRLTGLDTASVLSLDLLDPASADELFVAVAGNRTADPTEVSTVSELCGYLPLAIRLAAAKLRHRPTWSVAMLIDRLGDEHHRLDRLAAEDRSVAAAFSVSYQQLDPELRRLFHMIGVHPGRDFDLYAAAALADLPVPRTLELLDELYDHNLVQHRNQDRYSLHDLLRQFARELLAGAAEEQRNAGESRLFDHYIAAALAARAHLSSQASELVLEPERPTVLPPFDDRESALAWFAAEEDNLVVACRLAGLRADHRRAVSLPLAVGDYRTYWGGHQVWSEASAVAVQAAEALGDTRLLCATLLTDGNLAVNMGRSDEATALFERVLRVAVEGEHRIPQATALGGLAYLDVNAGRWESGAARYREALDLDRAVGEPRATAITLINLAHVCSQLDRLDEAFGLLDEAGQLAADHDLPDVALGVMINSGGDLLRLKRYPEAERRLVAALTMAREQGNPRALAAVLSSLAKVLRLSGRFRPAAEHLAEALELVRATGIVEDLAKVLVGLAEVENALGRSSAIDHAGEALTISTEHDMYVPRVRAQACLAVALRADGQTCLAREHAERALEAAEESGRGDPPELDEATRAAREVLASVPQPGRT